MSGTPTMSDDPFACRIPSGEEMRDEIHREGFHEMQVRLLDQRITRVAKDNNRLRDALRKEAERATAAEVEAEGWRDLAIKYGTQTEAERRKDVGQLRGQIAINRDMLRDANAADVITFTCIGLAKKLRAEAGIA